MNHQKLADHYFRKQDRLIKLEVLTNFDQFTVDASKGLLNKSVDILVMPVAIVATYEQVYDNGFKSGYTLHHRATFIEVMKIILTEKE